MPRNNRISSYLGNYSGFAFMEVMLGFVVLAIVVSSVAGLTIYNNRTVTVSQQKILALNLAQDKLESFKNLGTAYDEEGNFPDYPDYSYKSYKVESEEPVAGTYTIIIKVFYKSEQLAQLTGEVEASAP